MHDYTPRGEGEGASGWVRIGNYDLNKRRALWVRISRDTIELCAGREGDDAYVKVLADNPVFQDLSGCMARAVDAVHGDPSFDALQHPVQSKKSRKKNS